MPVCASHFIQSLQARNNNNYATILYCTQSANLIKVCMHKQNVEFFGMQIKSWRSKKNSNNVKVQAIKDQESVQMPLIE